LLISVVTISFNSSGSISDAIKSVNEQIYPHIEHVFVDGASSDNTLEIINKECMRDKIVISEPDTGIYQALNKGIHLCRGEYIVVLHSDDAFHSKNVLKFIVEKLQSEGLPDLMSGSVIHVDKLNHIDGAI
jgi:glycosyltransferase